MVPTHRRAFALVDLLALVLVAGALLAVLLGSVAHARTLSGEMTSSDNLRTLGAAHAAYAADWNDRQFTMVDDFLSSYGSGVSAAMSQYERENDACHPPVALGWGRLNPDDRAYRWLAYRVCFNCANATLVLPVEFTGEGCNQSLAYLGAFRLHNAYQFNQYVGGRFYDEVFYAANDEVVFDAVDDGGCFDVPDGFCRFAIVDESLGEIPAWSSYVMSPAAMFDPLVCAHDDPDDPDFNGFRDPWTFDEGFQSPSLAHALYPDLKSNLIEHHWLQNNPGETCNPGIDPGTYGDPPCEPYYFNHAAASSPNTLFYDGHVAEILAQDAVDDDAIVRDQNNPNWGLWSQDTPWGIDGYRSEVSFDGVRTSFHVLTTDGIRGRDVLGPGARSRERPTALPRVRAPRPATAPHRFDEKRPAAKIAISGE